MICSGKEKKLPQNTSARSNRSKKSSNSERSSSRGSKKSRKEKVKKESEVFMDLSTDLIIEVLKEKFKEFHVGVIIESLNSSIVRKPATTLNVILSALGNARYIHLILFCYTYNDYCIYKESVKEREKRKKLAEIKEILENITEMGADDFENLPQEIREIYKQNVLQARKIEFEKRKGSLRY